tara:strand:- start:58 stop:975 length:918 start_codon:yes stop_codon:yes gene_type:complete
MRELNVGNRGTFQVHKNLQVEWPNKSKFAICLTHDVDRIKKTYQYLTSTFKKKSLRPLIDYFKDKEEPYWQFEKIMDIEKSYNVKSTFFFLNESINFRLLDRFNWPLSLGRYNIMDAKVQKIIRTLDEGGWEIGLHGSIKSFNNIKLLSKEKKILETIIGHEISGIRQHWLNLEIPETWNIHRKLGLNYDTSFGHKYDVGFKDQQFHPFSPFGDDFLVFPLSIMDSYVFKKHTNYDEALEEVLRLIYEVKNKGGLLTILWHQRVFNENDFPNYSKLYKNIIEEGMKNEAWFATCKEVYNYLHDRG